MNSINGGADHFVNGDFAVKLKHVPGEQNRSHKKACPCCKACTKCSRDFVRVINLENSGLVVYKCTKKSRDVHKDVEEILSSVKVDDDVYIIHQTKNVDVKSADFTPKMESISCPRCRQLMHHSLKLLQNVPATQKDNVMDICEHCRLKAQPRGDCEELIKSLIRRYDLNKWNRERLGEWLTEINKITRDERQDFEERQSAIDFTKMLRDADSLASHQDDGLNKGYLNSNRILQDQKPYVTKYNLEGNKKFKSYTKTGMVKKTTGEKTLGSLETKFAKVVKKSQKKDAKHGTAKGTDKNKHEKDKKYKREPTKTVQHSSHSTDEHSKKERLDVKLKGSKLKPNVSKNVARSKSLSKSTETLDKLKYNSMIQARLENNKAKKLIEKDISINKIKMLETSQGDTFLNKVKINKPAKNILRKVPEPDTNSKFDYHEKWHKTWKDPNCSLCEDNTEKKKNGSVSDKLMKNKYSVSDVILGEKIVKNKPGHNIEPCTEDVKSVKPLLFERNHIQYTPIFDENAAGFAHPTPTSDTTSSAGIIRYALSDRSFIDKGWTILPSEKIVRKLNVYRMRPARPEFNWFEHNRNKGLLLYDSGERLADFDENGRGRWYYKNGRLALDYYAAEEVNAKQRFVIYSNGEPDERGRPRPYTILATFDYLGNGIVFDHSGKVRFKYNQTEGVVIDKSIGPISHWKWHTLNDPPVLHKILEETRLLIKDPKIQNLSLNDDSDTRIDDQTILDIEYKNLLKEKNMKLAQSFKLFQIRMKALKINENFSLKVLDQATVNLNFRDGTSNLKINIGMILDNKEIIDIATTEVGEVYNNIENVDAPTESLVQIQKHVANARRLEKNRTAREQKLHPPALNSSADKLTAGAFRRYPIVPSNVNVVATSNCCCIPSRC